MKKKLLVCLLTGLLLLTSIGMAHAKNLSKTEVSQLYVSIFGRASEGEGNSYWCANYDDMVLAAKTMLDTDAAKTYFGDTLNNNQKLIEFIYENTLGKTYSEDPDGVDYWVGELAHGNSKGVVIASLISAVMDSQYLGSTAQNRFKNKVAICNYTADTITSVSDANDLSSFVGFISDVTDESTTVTSAKDDVDTFTGKEKEPSEPLVSISQLVGLWAIQDDVSFEVLNDGSIINFTATLPMTDTYKSTDKSALSVTFKNVEIDSNDFTFEASFSKKTNNGWGEEEASMDGTFVSPDSAKGTWRASKTVAFNSAYKGSGDFTIKKVSSTPPVPSAPTGVSASKGTYDDKVKITWNSSAGADNYEVWRNTSDSPSSASKISTTTSTNYQNKSGTAGKKYYYWVKAVNSAGTSGFSSSDSGYKKVETSTPVILSMTLADTVGTIAQRSEITMYLYRDLTYEATQTRTIAGSGVYEKKTYSYKGKYAYGDTFGNWSYITSKDNPDAISLEYVMDRNFYMHFDSNKKADTIIWNLGGFAYLLTPKSGCVKTIGRFSSSTNSPSTRGDQCDCSYQSP